MTNALISTTLGKRTYYTGLVLKAGVILSGLTGVYLQVTQGSDGFMGTNFASLRYFTLQSNLWIAMICAVFLALDLRTKGNRSFNNVLYMIKFAFTVSIVLTFLVFSVLLSPLMS